MSTTTNPQVDLRMLEETRRHIKSLIDEVARLSESELPPADYYGELLKRVLAALAAPAGAVWLRGAQGNNQLAFQINLREVGLDRDEQSRRSHDELLRQSVNQPQAFHLLPHSGAGPAEEGKPAPGNPTNFILLLSPILLNSEVIGFLEVWQAPDRPLNAVQGFLQFLANIADLAARYNRNQRMRAMVGQEQVWTQLEAFARQVHASLSPTEVAYLTANEGRRLVDCDRVSVGIRMSRKMRVEAVSGSDVVEKRSNLVVLMRKLFDSVIRWGEKLIYNGTKDDSLPPDVLRDLDAYLAESNSKLLVVLPLKDEREKESTKPARSALLMECFEPPAEPQQLVSRLEVVGRHAAPALYNAIEYKRIPMRFLWVPLAKIQEGLGGKARMILYLILGILISLIALLVWVPADIKVEARGQILTKNRRTVYAPRKGTIQSIRVKPGNTVGPEIDLMIMYDNDLERQLKETDGAIRQADEMYRFYDQRIKDKGNNADAADKSEKARWAGTLAQAVDRRKSLLRDLHEIPRQPGAFYVKSPQFNAEENAQREAFRARNGLHAVAPRWRVLNSDFEDNLLGRSVDQSVPLLKLGEPESGFEVELKIPQKHFYQVMRGFKRLDRDWLEVDILVRSEPTRTFKGRLYQREVGGEATPQRDDNNESEPVVFVKVSIDDPGIPEKDRIPDDLLTPGMEVVTKIRCGESSLGYSLFYGVWDWTCEKILFSF